MTREERLDWLCRLRSGLVWFNVPPKERPMFEDALSEEIKALSAEPREALVREWCKQNGYVMMPEAIYEQDVTKAYFDGQNAGWIMNKCSNCGAINASAYKNYCPNCGAKIVESEDTNAGAVKANPKTISGDFRYSGQLQKGGANE